MEENMKDETKSEMKNEVKEDHGGECCDCNDSKDCHCCGHHCDHHYKGKNWNGGGSNAVYGLGMIGALIYFIGTASNLGEGLFGIIKAILWPAYFVYYILESLSIPI